MQNGNMLIGMKIQKPEMMERALSYAKVAVRRFLVTTVMMQSGYGTGDMIWIKPNKK